MTNPVLRSATLHAITFVGGVTAAVTFMSSHSVDLYAVYDALNVVVADITKLLGLVIPIISGTYAAFKATSASKVADLAASPDTTVSAGGNTITLLTPKLQAAAKNGS